MPVGVTLEATTMATLTKGNFYVGILMKQENGGTKAGESRNPITEKINERRRLI